MAMAFTKDLVAKGRLPFRNPGDRLSNYGKGFSNLLTIAGQNSGLDNYKEDEHPKLVRDESIQRHNLKDSPSRDEFKAIELQKMYPELSFRPLAGNPKKHDGSTTTRFPRDNSVNKLPSVAMMHMTQPATDRKFKRGTGHTNSVANNLPQIPANVDDYVSSQASEQEMNSTLPTI